MPRKRVSSEHSTGVILSPEERRFIRHEMHRRGWQQTDLARAAGLSQMTISSALRGYGMWAKNRIAIYEAFEAHPAKEYTQSA